MTAELRFPYARILERALCDVAYLDATDYVATTGKDA